VTLAKVEDLMGRGAAGRKMRAITEWLRAQPGGVLIGFSGGVDSTFLAAVAAQTLGRRALAVTIDSPFLARSELREARALARLIGIRHRVVRLDVMDDAELIANPPDRCYHCKKLDFAVLLDLARQGGLGAVCDGSNQDDDRDYRPGSRATRELGVSSPLKLCGFTKNDIRAASRKLRLPTADKPAMACLASRFPYGTPITRDALTRIEQAENALAGMGFHQCRVRLHGDLARVELPPGDLKRAVSRAANIDKFLKKAGFRYVTLDLQGYRMGSLNEALSRGQRLL
jgi:uncharacterized protein